MPTLPGSSNRRSFHRRGRAVSGSSRLLLTCSNSHRIEPEWAASFGYRLITSRRLDLGLVLVYLPTLNASFYVNVPSARRGMLAAAMIVSNSRETFAPDIKV